jgi:Sensors of blue-light using FAD
MSLIQLVYVSRPFGFDAAILSHILFQARDHNARVGITGALICRADIYLQLLEGPQDAIDVLYRNIQRDDRHVEVKKLLQRPIVDRMFAGWAMKDDPAHSWMWTQAQVDDGAVDRSTEAEILAVFERVKDQS